jgi:hypothetical protein
MGIIIHTSYPPNNFCRLSAFHKRSPSPIAGPPEAPSWLYTQLNFCLSKFQTFSLCDKTDNAPFNCTAGAWGKSDRITLAELLQRESWLFAASIIWLISWFVYAFLLFLGNFHFQNVHLFLFFDTKLCLSDFSRTDFFLSHSGFGTDFLGTFHKTWGGVTPPPHPP